MFNLFSTVRDEWRKKHPRVPVRNGELFVAAFAGTAGILEIFIKIGAFLGNGGAFMAVNTIHLFAILFHSLMNFIQLFVPKGERADEHSGDYRKKEHVFHD
jgi:hypothetical protein